MSLSTSWQQHEWSSTDTFEPTIQHTARGEQALWTAVITQALMDAASGSGKTEARKDKTRALTWLELADIDFHDVCDLAGLDPSYVADRAQLALERNCRWRLPAGEGWRSKMQRSKSSASRALEAV